MPMKLKMDGDKAVLSSDGHPVYVNDEDGSEVPVNGPMALAKIAELTGEAKRHRESRDSFESKLKLFDGLDPEAARKALETISNLDQSKLIEAGKVDEIKAGIVKANEENLAKIMREHGEKLAAAEKLAKELEAQLYQEKIGGAFARSKFIESKIAVPSDMMQSLFGPKFKIEGGKIVVYGHDGNKVFSRTKHGEPAEFEEGLEILVDGYPNRDAILKGTGGGSGGRGSNGSGPGGKTISRENWEKMDHADRAAKMADGYKVV